MMKRFRDKLWLVPTALWSALFLFSLVWLSFGQRKFHSVLRALLQWDGQNYLSIARDGYQVYPCGFNPNWLCGNVGWFPFYPVVGKIFATVTFIEIPWAMAIVDWLAFLAALILLARLVNRRLGANVSRGTILALIVFPSSFYFFAGFPYATYLLLAVIIFTLLESGRYWWTVLPAACLALTYPSGLNIGLPLAWILMTKWKEITASKRLALVSAIVAVGLSLFLYAGYYWWKFDDFFLFQHFQSQSFYGHRITFPLLTFYRSLRALPPSSPEFIAIAFVVLTAILFYCRRIPAAWQLYALGILLFTPTFGNTSSYYRRVIVAFPLFAMMALSLESRWRRYLFGGYVVAAVVLMVTVFFAAFKHGTLM